MPTSSSHRFAMGVFLLASSLLLLATSLPSSSNNSRHQGRMLQQKDEFGDVETFFAPAINNSNTYNETNNATDRSEKVEIVGEDAEIAPLPMTFSLLGLGAGVVATMKVVQVKNRRSDESRKKGSSNGRLGDKRSKAGRRKTVVRLVVDNSDSQQHKRERKSKVLRRPSSGNGLGGFLTRNGPQRSRRGTFQSPKPGDQWGLRLVPTPGKVERNADHIGALVSLSFMSHSNDSADVSRVMRRVDTKGAMPEQLKLEPRGIRRTETSDSDVKFKERYMHHANLKWKRKGSITPMTSAKATRDEKQEKKTWLKSRLAEREENERTHGEIQGSNLNLEIDQIESETEDETDADSRVESLRRVHSQSTHTPTTRLIRKSTMSLVFSQLVRMTYGDKKDRVSNGTLVLCRCKRRRKPVEYDGLTMKQLRHVCWVRGINPGGSHDALVCKLMISRADLGMATCKQCLLNILDPNIGDEEEEEEEMENWSGAGNGNDNMNVNAWPDWEGGGGGGDADNRSSSLNSPWGPTSSRSNRSLSELV